MTKKILAFLFFISAGAHFCSGQAAESPVEHMTFLSDREELLRKKYLSYMSEVAHGARARKMEKRRAELINAIQDVIKEAGRVRPYKGDVTLRNAFVEYWNILLHIFKEDYHKIVDMEEVAEQSFDMMEAYMLAQDKADEKLKQAYQKVTPAYEAFAAKHNITLTEGQQTKLSRKLDKVGSVNNYISQLFLIYFKSAVQETNLGPALKANDINAVEQTNNALLKYAKEGLVRLDTLKPYDGDGSLITACRKVLEFHQMEAEKKIPQMSDYLIKSDEFGKIKKAFDNKPAAKRTQADVDTFNKAVNDINKEGLAYNKVAEELFKAREKVSASWDQTKRRFMDAHIPYN
jgi:hypothetical protein